MIGRGRLPGCQRGKKMSRAQARLRFFEIALVIVRRNHLASCIVNADHSIM